MYYQYGEWKEVKMNYEKAQVISTFLCRVEEFKGLRVGHGGHGRSGLATTAKLIRKFSDGATSVMGLEYPKFKFVRNEIEHEEEAVTKLKERTLAHFLLLPYVLPNKTFDK